MKINRRQVLQLGASAAAIGATATITSAQAQRSTGTYAADILGKYPYKAQPLGYAFNALEPHFDALTMEIHSGRHHPALCATLNGALEKAPALQSVPLTKLLSNIAALPADLQTAIRNGGGGHMNHALFWKWLEPGGAKAPMGDVAKAIDSDLGGFEAVKTKFAAAAAGRFGSGWAWIVLDPFGKLQIVATPYQDNPIMDGMLPVLGLDVWEHSYYLKYYNKRADYIAAFWNVVNWDAVERSYQQAKASM